MAQSSVSSSNVSSSNVSENSFAPRGIKQPFAGGKREEEIKKDFKKDFRKKDFSRRDDTKKNEKIDLTVEKK